jgi:hypothetical protein
MKRILDCLVNYFGLDEEERPTYRRYFCYHIFAGPGATRGSGVASITTLAVSDEKERCTYCQKLHAVDTGGPAAALAKAIRYLDAYHEGEHLRRVQSEVRGLAGDPPAEATPLAETFAVRPGYGITTGTTMAPAPLLG